ncbi:MAG: PaaI family thioesterase [Phenylobacterium sp.]|uniref:PaaI family thioesterase n=1 Tax=Phenylobacterium sp. TaxID=1871053 RepID=UPI003016C9DD
MTTGSDDTSILPPEGFVRSSSRGPYSMHNGPYFHREIQGEATEHAFLALPRHANGLGLVHGGMLTSFMDGLLAAAVWRASHRSSVTIHLSVDFLHMARVGQWVFGESRVTRLTRDVAFVEGRAHAVGADVVRASGVFKLMRKPAE